MTTASEAGRVAVGAGGLKRGTLSFRRRLVDILSKVSSSLPIGVLGLSYKPDTAVVEQSQGVALVERLMQLGHEVVAYDPKATAAAQRALLTPFRAAESADECVRAASLRHRQVRIIRDYGMFERREAPQFYPDVKT